MFGSSNHIIIQTQTSKTTQKWVTEHKTKLLLWPFQSSDPNPKDNEWGELKRRSTVMELNLRGLEWFWMKEWSLISCQVFSNLIRHYRRTIELYRASGAIESVLTQCISVWYNNATNQDCKALQRVVRLAERISGSTLPSLQGIYLKRCRSRTAKIIKDSNHPGNHLFILLPSGKRFRSMLAKTERLRKSFFPQAIRLLNSGS